MSRWGEMDKDKIVYVLDNGIAYLKDMVKTKEKDINDLWGEFKDLEDLLYGEGKELLSITNQVRFEKRLNTVRNKLEKGW